MMISKLLFVSWIWLKWVRNLWIFGIFARIARNFLWRAFISMSPMFARIITGCVSAYQVFINKLLIPSGVLLKWLCVCQSHTSKNIMYKHEVSGKFISSLWRLLLFSGRQSSKPEYRPPSPHRVSPTLPWAISTGKSLLLILSFSTSSHVFLGLLTGSSPLLQAVYTYQIVFFRFFQVPEPTQSNSTDYRRR